MKGKDRPHQEGVDLFGWAERRRPRSAKARKRDPKTSHDGAASVDEDNVSKQLALLAQAGENLGDATQFEWIDWLISQGLYPPPPPGADRYGGIRPRFKVGEARGMFERVRDERGKVMTVKGPSGSPRELWRVIKR